MFGIYTIVLASSLIEQELENILCDAEVDPSGDGTMRTPLAYTDPLTASTTGLLPHLATAEFGYTRIAGSMGGWVKKESSELYVWVIRVAENKIQVGWLGNPALCLPKMFFRKYLNIHFIKVIETDPNAPMCVLKPWLHKE